MGGALLGGWGYIPEAEEGGWIRGQGILTVGCLLALLAPGFLQDVHTGNSEQGGGEVSLSCLPWSL